MKPPPSRPPTLDRTDVAAAAAAAAALRRSPSAPDHAGRALGAVMASAGLAVALAGASCGGTEKAPAVAAPASGGAAARSETIDHQACDLSGAHVERLDTNGDGRPDIQRVYDEARHELCRAVDLNRDGRVDLYEYFDGSGAVRRREFCYGDTGEVNAVETYQAGKLTERAYDTTGQHKIDTWDWFDPAAAIDAKTGRPVHPARRERDLMGIGIVNQWWTWSGDQVTISTDRNGDGKPDPDSTVVLGGGDDGGGAAAVAPAAQAPAVMADGGASTVTGTGAGMEGGAK